MRQRWGDGLAIRVLVVALILAVALVVFFVTRGGDDESEEPLNPLLRGGGSSRVDSVEEAQSLLPFDIALPSFFPAGVSPMPGLSVMEDDGAPYMLVAEYPEASTAPADGSLLRMTIYQAGGSPSFVPETPERELILVQGIRLWVTPLEAEEGGPQAVAAWNYGGVGFFAEFAWLTREAGADEGLTHQMRVDVIRVMESVLDG